VLSFFSITRACARGTKKIKMRHACVTWHHLVSYWARIFPNHFEAVAVLGAEPFFTQIALACAVDPPRARALKAF
jgi:hypothetical protein